MFERSHYFSLGDNILNVIETFELFEGKDVALIISLEDTAISSFCLFDASGKYFLISLIIDLSDYITSFLNKIIHLIKKYN